jgi:DNA-binding SARP family transcriptional activator
VSLTIQLLGRPCISRGADEVYRFRSRKSWGLLAYLMLSERPPTRSQAAALLFGDADDPARALRWSLSEIRRTLGEDGSVDDDLTLRSLRHGAALGRAADADAAALLAAELAGDL